LGPVWRGKPRVSGLTPKVTLKKLTTNITYLHDAERLVQIDILHGSRSSNNHSYCAINVPHCWILSPDKTEWRLILATLCGWRRCFVADQLWFMTCIREEEWVNLYTTQILRSKCNAVDAIRHYLMCAQRNEWDKRLLTTTNSKRIRRFPRWLNLRHQLLCAANSF